MMQAYSILKKKHHRSIKVSEMPLSACVLGPRSDLVITAGWDNNVCIYSVDRGAMVYHLTAHDDAVTSLAIKNATLVSGSWDSTVREWKCLGPQMVSNRSLHYQLDEQVQYVSLMDDEVTAAGIVLRWLCIFSFDSLIFCSFFSWNSSWIRLFSRPERKKMSFGHSILTPMLLQDFVLLQTTTS